MTKNVVSDKCYRFVGISYSYNTGIMIHYYFLDIEISLQEDIDTNEVRL